MNNESAKKQTQKMKHSIILPENNEKYIHKICFFTILLGLNIVSIKNNALKKLPKKTQAYIKMHNHNLNIKRPVKKNLHIKRMSKLRKSVLLQITQIHKLQINIQ